MRRLFWVLDDLAADFRSSLDWPFIDSAKYEIKPRKSFLDELIKNKEEEITFAEKQQKVNNDYYEERKRQLIEERDRLVKQKQEKG